MNNQSYRQAIGQKLEDFRKSQNLSMYRVAKNGDIKEHSVAAVEKGETAYTIDSLLGYLEGCNLHLFIGEKDNPIDVDDLLKSMPENPSE
ncbi:hypothetical protein Barb6_03704 [Bacteroidales bacterium Barb6]|nr:hypothetical protein Barb6_03704 [Bacteroidales bacterium Barb6]OAV76056.1 hypothetical protein Barb7_00290 [Bacteroidales bacterium Barb7]